MNHQSLLRWFRLAIQPSIKARKIQMIKGADHKGYSKGLRKN